LLILQHNRIVIHNQFLQATSKPSLTFSVTCTKSVIPKHSMHLCKDMHHEQSDTISIRHDICDPKTSLPVLEIRPSSRMSLASSA